MGIALNKNAIPFDPLPPATASGIRVGTPGPATLGMDDAEMEEIAAIIGEALRRPRGRGGHATGPGGRVRDLMARFPVYPG